MKVKEESEKVGLKLNIYKTKIMASGPITSWQIDGEKNEKVIQFIFLDSKFTADGDFSLLWRKAATNLNSLLKSRDITLPTKICLVKAMIFPIVMYGCEGWTVKKAERWRIDAYSVVLEKTLESPLEYKEIQPVYLKGNRSWICWSWSSNILATRWEELIHWRRPWCWERLNAGGEGDNGGWDGWMASPTQWTWVWVSSRSSWWTEKLGVLQSIGSQRVG